MIKRASEFLIRFFPPSIFYMFFYFVWIRAAVLKYTSHTVTFYDFDCLPKWSTKNVIHRNRMLQVEVFSGFYKNDGKKNRWIKNTLSVLFESQMDKKNKYTTYSIERRL